MLSKEKIEEVLEAYDLTRSFRSAAIGPMGGGSSAGVSTPSLTRSVCAWLAWSRFRVIIPLADKTLPSVIATLDRCFRTVGDRPRGELEATRGENSWLPVRRSQRPLTRGTRVLFLS